MEVAWLLGLVSEPAPIERSPSDFAHIMGPVLSLRVKNLLRLRWGRLVAGYLAHAAAAQGADPALVELSCLELDQEQAAEVEARVRASLLVSPVSASRVALSCAPGLVSVTVYSGAEHVTQEVPIGGADTRDVLLGALERALGQLPAPKSPGSSPTVVPDAEHAAVAPVTAERSPEPLPSPSTPPLAAAAATSRIDSHRAPAFASDEHARAAELFLLGDVESWSGDLAIGGTLGMAYGARRLAATLTFGALAAESPSQSFGATELHAALGFRYEPAWSLGVRAGASVGGSLLLVRPRSDVKPLGSTSVAAAGCELQLSRPFWFGSWSLVPAARLRLFADERRVTLDAEPRLLLGKLVPGAALGVSYRFR